MRYLICIVVSLIVSCSQNTNNSKTSVTNGDATNCKIWQENSTDHISHFRGSLVSGGVLTLTSGTLDLTFSGTLNAYNISEKVIPITSLLSRYNPGESFILKVKV